MATPIGSATAVKKTLCESGMACLGIRIVTLRSKEVLDLKKIFIQVFYMIKFGFRIPIKCYFTSCPRKLVCSPSKSDLQPEQKQDPIKLNFKTSHVSVSNLHVTRYYLPLRVGF